MEYNFWEAFGALCGGGWSKKLCSMCGKPSPMEEF